MALTIQISKVSVSKQQEGLFNISINLRCLEGITEVLNKFFNVRFKPGQKNIENKINEMQKPLQQAIDDYKKALKLLAIAKAVEKKKAQQFEMKKIQQQQQGEQQLEKMRQQNQSEVLRLEL